MKAIIDYLATLPLVGGDHDGENFKVLPWERRCSSWAPFRATC